LHGTHFVDSLKGWAVGDYGIILHTTNGGVNWSSQNSGTNSPLRSVSFSDHHNGYAAGGLGTILKTTNGGTTWTRIFHDTSRNVTHFEVRSFGSTTYILRNYFDIDYYTDYRIWKTTDWGNAWDEVTPPNSFNDEISDMHFVDSVRGWTCGSGAIPHLYHAEIHRTTDGGLSWNIVTFGGQFQSMRKIFFANRTTGWALKVDTVFRSTDRGLNWNAVSATLMNYATDLVMFGDTGYVSLDAWVPFKKTTNSGISWFEQSPSSIQVVLSMSFISPDLGWAVGRQGQIVHTTNGGITPVSQDPFWNATIPNSFGLNQNYPNPFNPVTTIKYELPRESKTTLKVFNALGQEIATLVDEQKQPGRYEVQWNAENFPSGVYFCRLQAGSFAQAKTLVVIK